MLFYIVLLLHVLLCVVAGVQVAPIQTTSMAALVVDNGLILWTAPDIPLTYPNTSKFFSMQLQQVVEAAPGNPLPVQLIMLEDVPISVADCGQASCEDGGITLTYNLTTTVGFPSILKCGFAAVPGKPLDSGAGFLDPNVVPEAGSLIVTCNVPEWQFSQPENRLRLVFQLTNEYQIAPNVKYSFAHPGLPNATLIELQVLTADAIVAVAFDSLANNATLKSGVRTSLTMDGVSWLATTELPSLRSESNFRYAVLMRAGYLAVLKSSMDGATLAIVFGTMMGVLLVVSCFFAGWKWHQRRQYLRHLLVHSNGRGFDQFPIPSSGL